MSKAYLDTAKDVEDSVDMVLTGNVDAMARGKGPARSEGG